MVFRQVRFSYRVWWQDNSCRAIHRL